MALNLYKDVVLPFTGQINNGLFFKSRIVVKGTPKGKDRFTIGLKCGLGATDNIAFHCSPRFDENEVVRNTMWDETWGPEERSGGFPFKKKEPFDMEIHVMMYKYRVFVNGRHFCDYDHRIAVNQVNHIRVSGGVRVEAIEIWGQASQTFNSFGAKFKIVVCEKIQN